MGYQRLIGLLLFLVFLAPFSLRASFDDGGADLRGIAWKMENAVLQEQAASPPVTPRAGPSIRFLPLGSTLVALFDEQGNLVQRNTYDSYGNLKAIKNAAGQDIQDQCPENLFGFQGRELDRDTGLMYFRARWYDPQIRRFISEDPVWSTNLYSFVGNNPVNFVDPMGLKLLQFATGEEQEEFDTWAALLHEGKFEPTAIDDQPIEPGFPSTLDYPFLKGINWGMGLAKGLGKAAYQATKDALEDIAWDQIPNWLLTDETGGSSTPPKQAKSRTVEEILKEKKGSIKNAPLPDGSPSWESIFGKTEAEIEAEAKKGTTGFKKFKKLLTDKRFDK